MLLRPIFDKLRQFYSKHTKIPLLPIEPVNYDASVPIAQEVVVLDPFKSGVDYHVIEEYLDYISSGYNGGNKKQKGDIFEALSKYYLTNHPDWKDRFRSVWLWNERPDRYRWGGIDKGVDLLAETPEGWLWAIQCKCFRQDNSVTHGDISSFLSESARSEVDTRLLITTTDKIGKNAAETLENQQIPVQVLKRSDFAVPFDAKRPFRWPKTIRVRGKEIVLVRQKSPKPTLSQQTALSQNTTVARAGVSSWSSESSSRTVRAVHESVRYFFLAIILLFGAISWLYWAVNDTNYSSPVDTPISTSPKNTRQYQTSAQVDMRTNSPEAFQFFAKVESVKAVAGEVSFSNLYPLIAIRHSSSDVALGHFVTGEILAHERFDVDLFTVQWSAQDKLMAVPQSSVTETVLSCDNADFVLAPLGDTDASLIRLFPTVESLGVMHLDTSEIQVLAVNDTGSKFSYCLQDSSIWVAVKSGSNTYTTHQLCVETIGTIADISFIDADQIIIGSEDGGLAIYSMHQELAVQTFESAEAGLSAMTVSPDGTLLVAGFNSGLVSVFSILELANNRQLKGFEQCKIVDVIFRDDSHAFATISDNGDVRVFGTDLAQASTFPEKQVANVNLSREEILEQILNRLDDLSID